LAAAFSAYAHEQWTQPIGFAHAVFEVAFAALAKTNGPGDKAGFINAVKDLRVDTVVGPLEWPGPVANVAKTPLVGGQWRKATKYPYEIVIVSNSLHPNIPKASAVELIR